MNPPLQELQSLGWEWRDDGAVVTVVVNGSTYRVYVPIRTLSIVFGRELKAAGCPMGKSVGAQRRAVGLFGSIVKSVKKFGRKAGRAISKGARKVARGAKKVAKGAKKVVQNPYFRAGVAGAAMAFPALAPVAAGVETANQVLKQYDRARAIAKRVQRGVKNPQDIPKLAAGLASEHAIREIAQRAQQGDPAAQRAYNALQQVQRGRKVAKQARRIQRTVKNPRRRKALLRRLARRAMTGQMRETVRRGPKRRRRMTRGQARARARARARSMARARSRMRRGRGRGRGRAAAAQARRKAQIRRRIAMLQRRLKRIGAMYVGNGYVGGMPWAQARPSIGAAPQHLAAGHFYV